MKEKIKDSLLGVAIGDALGFPFEGSGPIPDLDLSHYHRGTFPEGTWSDDTSLTFLTAESLMEKGGLDLHDLATRFLAWLEEGYFAPFGKAIGIGRATREALWRFKQGVPPDRCGGRGERDNGNGGLMRILPVIWWYLSEDKQDLIHQVHRACSLTHAHPRSLIACGMVALTMKRLTEEIPLAQAIDQAIEEARSYYQKEEPFRKELPHFEKIFSLDALSLADLRPTGYVVHTLEVVFFLLRKSLSFEEAVVSAVRLGGDADTISSIIGGIAGAYWGGLPRRWIEGLVKKDLLEEVCQRFTQQVQRYWETSSAR